MTDLTVQFDRRNVALDFDAAPVPAIVIRQLPDPAVQMELARHRHAMESTLSAIASRLERDAVAFNGLRDRLRQDFVRYAELVAKSVFTRDAALIAQRLQELLIDALAEFKLDDDVHVWVHPDCLAIVEECRAGTALKFQLLADPLLQPGDCHIESAGSGLLARLEKQLEFCQGEMISPSATGASGP